MPRAPSPPVSGRWGGGLVAPNLLQGFEVYPAVRLTLMGTPERIAAANSALSNTLNAPEPEEGGEGEEDENEPKMSVRTIELEDEESPRRRGEQRLGSSRKKIYPQVVCPVYAGSYIGLW